MGTQGTIGYNCPLTGEPRTIPAAAYNPGQPLPISAQAEEIFRRQGLDWRAIYTEAEEVEEGYGLIALRSEYRKAFEQYCLSLEA